ncbi:hypothetical protein ANANG_G00237870 [Anguilla anguilla]|uniref:Interleukin n=1 Tax=Anguilla anguilla TaxID=7936 RepID=A0A9D3LYM7_ANGAN|nr:hypothetical protein ANANG_G00237870 [Anguilla anguilla]
MLHGISQVESSAMSKRLRREISSCHLFTSALSLLYLVIMPTVCANSRPPRSLELFELVDDMLTYTDAKCSIEQCSIEGGLYTPNKADYEKCPKSTLTCFAEEVKVLLYHIPALQKKIEKIKGDLNRRLTSINKREDHGNCSQCEVNKMESAVTFLKTLKYILQMINERSGGGQS